jgi:hypothetical protein
VQQLQQVLQPSRKGVAAAAAALSTSNVDRRGDLDFLLLCMCTVLMVEHCSIKKFLTAQAPAYYPTAYHCVAVAEANLCIASPDPCPALP